VSFARTTAGTTPLALQNGWTNSPQSTRPAAARVIDGWVHFQGAIANGTNEAITVLPPNLRPATGTYLNVAMCDGTKGRLLVGISGVLAALPESDFAKASCITSLEGAVYPLAAFRRLELLNGWQGGVFGSARPAATVHNGIVQLQGGVGSGTSGGIFNLPTGMRPATHVFLAVDLCNGQPGHLHIRPDGLAMVEPYAANAQCFTSLEGASFATSPYGFPTLTLENGWTGKANSTSQPAGRVVDGVVHLKGGISGGSSQVFTHLPAGLRPVGGFRTTPADMCDATRGETTFGPDGESSVYVQPSLTAAHCFTSLDGITFVRDLSTYAPVPLTHAWTGNFRASTVDGIVRFGGAVSGGSTFDVGVLPEAYRPTHDVYVSVSVCGSSTTKARLFIRASTGEVAVQPANASLADAQCQVYLDGVSFVP
jgi:hypothetical protein